VLFGWGFVRLVLEKTGQVVYVDFLTGEKCRASGTMTVWKKMVRLGSELASTKQGFAPFLRSHLAKEIGGSVEIRVSFTGSWTQKDVSPCVKTSMRDITKKRRGKDRAPLTRIGQSAGKRHRRPRGISNKAAPTHVIQRGATWRGPKKNEFLKEFAKHPHHSVQQQNEDG